MKPHSDTKQTPSDSTSKLTFAKVDLTRPATDGADDLRQPHEHDESPKAGTDRQGSLTPPPRQVIEQGASDVAQGLRDTERRGIPSDVPTTAKGSGSGEAPEAGIDRYSTEDRASQMDKASDEAHMDVRKAPRKRQ